MGLRPRSAPRSTADRQHSGHRALGRGARSSVRFAPEYGYYAMRAGAPTAGSATRQVCCTVCTIGGERGLFYADILWNIRRAIDWLVGG